MVCVKAALKEMVQELESNLPWIERLDLTLRPIRPPNPLQEQLGTDPDDLSADEIHNDVKREMKLWVMLRVLHYYVYTL